MSPNTFQIIYITFYSIFIFKGGYLTWLDCNGTNYERLEAGVEKGVLYVQNTDGTYNKGVAWNGLTGVNVSPSGAEPTKLWANNAQYGTVLSQEELGATIEAYTYPDEFAVCDGSAELAPGVHVGQQTRMPFALTYVTKIGNDVQSLDHGYKIHIIYGALAAPSEKNYQTINESPAITFYGKLQQRL